MDFKIVFFNVILCCLSCFYYTERVIAHGVNPQLELVVSRDGANHLIKKVTFDELSSNFADQKQRKKKEVLLAQILERGLEFISPESRTEIDLLILVNHQKEWVSIPRWVLTKYPYLLALRLDSKGEIVSCLRDGKNQKNISQKLSVEKFFLHQILRLEFSSYKDQYGPLLLKRRTNPVDILGEKLFVENCTSCHFKDRARGVESLFKMVSSLSSDKMKLFVQRGHFPQKSKQEFPLKNRRAVADYWSELLKKLETKGM